MLKATDSNAALPIVSKKRKGKGAVAAASAKLQDVRERAPVGDHITP